MKKIILFTLLIIHNNIFSMFYNTPYKEELNKLEEEWKKLSKDRHFTYQIKFGQKPDSEFEHSVNKAKHLRDLSAKLFKEVKHDIDKGENNTKKINRWLGIFSCGSNAEEVQDCGNIFCIAGTLIFPIQKIIGLACCLSGEYIYRKGQSFKHPITGEKIYSEDLSKIARRLESYKNLFDDEYKFRKNHLELINEIKE